MSSTVTLDFFIKIRQAGNNILSQVSRSVKQANDNMVAFNKTTMNGGAALQRYLGLAGTYLGAQKIREAGAAAEESLRTIRQIQRGLNNIGEKTQENVTSLIRQAQSIQEVTGISDEVLKEVQATLLAFEATKDETEALTPGVLDFAKSLKIDTRSAATLVGKALAGSGTELSRYGIHLDENKPKIDALTEALQRFRGAAEADVAYPALTKLRAVTADIIENAGLSGMRYAERFFEGLSNQLAKIRERQSAKTDPVQGLAGDLLSGLGSVVGSNIEPIAAASAFLLTTVMIKKVWGQIAAIVNAGFVFLTGSKLTQYIAYLQMFTKEYGLLNGIWSALVPKAMNLKNVIGLIGKSAALGATLLTAAWAGWNIGSMIRELKIAGSSIGDWVTLAIGYIYGFVIETKAMFLIWGKWTKTRFKEIIKEWKLHLMEFADWYTGTFADTWVGRKLGIDTLNDGLKDSIETTKNELSTLWDVYDFEKAKIKADADKDKDFYIGVGKKIFEEGKKQPEEKTFGAPQTPTVDTSTSDLLNDAVKKAQERYELETKIMAAEAAGNTSVADALNRRIREEDALESLLGDKNEIIKREKKLQEELKAATDKGDQNAIKAVQSKLDRLNEYESTAKALVTARLDLEDQEIARDRAKAELAEKRSKIESDLTRLQTERQIANDRGDLVEVNRLLEVEKGLINELIDHYKALAKAAKEGSAEQADALAKIAELQGRLNTSGNQTTRIGTIQQDYADLNDPTKHLQGDVTEGFGAGIMSWVTQIGTVADQVANTISNVIGSAVDGITDGIDGWMTGTKSFGDAMLDMWGNIRKAAIKAVVDWLAQQLLANTLGLIDFSAKESAKSGLALAWHAASKAKMFAIDVVYAAKGLAIQAASAAKSLILWLPSAIAASISSWGAAGALGAAAAIAAIAAVGGALFDIGGFTAPGDKNKPAGIVHADEWVAPKWMRNHPVWGSIIMGLEGVRTRGFSGGGFTTMAPNMDPAFALVGNLSSSSRNDQPQQGQAAPQQQQVAPVVHVGYYDTKKAMLKAMKGQSGQKIMVNGGSRAKRNQERLRA